MSIRLLRFHPVPGFEEGVALVLEFFPESHVGVVGLEGAEVHCFGDFVRFFGGFDRPGEGGREGVEEGSENWAVGLELVWDDEVVGEGGFID